MLNNVWLYLLWLNQWYCQNFTFIYIFSLFCDDVMFRTLCFTIGNDTVHSLFPTEGTSAWPTYSQGIHFPMFPNQEMVSFSSRSQKPRTSRRLNIFQTFPPCIQNALFSSTYSERVAGIEATSIRYTKVLLLTHAVAQHPEWGCPYTAKPKG